MIRMIQRMNADAIDRAIDLGQKCPYVTRVGDPRNGDCIWLEGKPEELLAKFRQIVRDTAVLP